MNASDVEKIVSCGGLVACFDEYTYNNLTTEISHCYNTGDVLANIDNGITYTGGIIGQSACDTGDKNVSIKIYSCYNVGEMESMNIAGIINMHEEGMNADVDNCFMSEYDNGYGENVTDDFMKAEEFVSMLNKYEGIFVKDVEPFANEGYPVIDFSNMDIIIDVDESYAEDVVSVYPNPAKDIVKLSSLGCHPSVIRVINTLGILVEEVEYDS